MDGDSTTVTTTTDNDNSSDILNGPFKPGTDGDKYWKKVQENPNNFDTWTYILQTVDTQGEIASIRTVYDEFLDEYPLCYVYWKKYAEYEARQPVVEGEEVTPVNKAVGVYERGVAAVSASVDLWLNYITYLISSNSPRETIISVMDRALEAAGRDPAAGPIYDKCLEYENDAPEPNRTGEIYRRVVSLPINALDSYYEKWKTYAESNDISHLATQEEKEAVEGDESTLKENILTAVEATYKAAKEEAQKRQPLESVVSQRTYFHYKAMDRAKLEAWHKYLDLASTSDDPKAAIAVFERCIIPCANYLPYYKRYAYYLQERGEEEGARQVLLRAALSIQKRRPSAHLALALFEEAQGNIEEAKKIYETVRAAHATHVESIVRFAQFEGRTSGHDAGAAVYEAALPSFTDDDSSRLFLVKKYAEFVGRVQGDSEGARSLVVRLLSLDTTAQKNDVVGEDGEGKGEGEGEGEGGNEGEEEESGEKEKMKEDESIEEKSNPEYIRAYVNVCAWNPCLVDDESRTATIAAYNRAVSSPTLETDLTCWTNYAEYVHTFCDVGVITEVDARIIKRIELMPGVGTTTTSGAAGGGTKRTREEVTSVVAASPTLHSLRTHQVAKQPRVGGYGAVAATGGYTPTPVVPTGGYPAGTATYGMSGQHHRGYVPHQSYGTAVGVQSYGSAGQSYGTATGSQVYAGNTGQSYGTATGSQPYAGSAGQSYGTSTSYPYGGTHQY